MLVAKCAFSERRNDSNVLAAVITGTLPRAELTEKSEQCFCSYSGFHEWSIFIFFYRVRERILTTDRNLKKYIYVTLKNDCCVILLYFQPNRLHWLRALCEIYGSLFSWLKWTVAPCIPADG